MGKLNLEHWGDFGWKECVKGSVIVLHLKDLDDSWAGDADTGLVWFEERHYGDKWPGMSFNTFIDVQPHGDYGMISSGLWTFFRDNVVPTCITDLIPKRCGR